MCDETRTCANPGDGRRSLHQIAGDDSTDFPMPKATDHLRSTPNLAISIHLAKTRSSDALDVENREQTGKAATWRARADKRLHCMLRRPQECHRLQIGMHGAEKNDRERRTQACSNCRRALSRPGRMLRLVLTFFTRSPGVRTTLIRCLEPTPLESLGTTSPPTRSRAVDVSPTRGQRMFSASASRQH